MLEVGARPEAEAAEEVKLDSGSSTPPCLVVPLPGNETAQKIQNYDSNIDFPTSQTIAAMPSSNGVRDGNVTSVSVESILASEPKTAPNNATVLSSELIVKQLTIEIPEEGSKAPSSAAAGSPAKTLKDFVYQVKWIDFGGFKSPVITQNTNGPCPMIAIANVLLLSNRLVLKKSSEIISGDRLIGLLFDLLISSTPKV